MDRTMGCLDWIWVREWWCIGKGTLRGFGGPRWTKLRLTWCGFADCPAVSGRWTDSPPVPPWCCDGECCFDYGGARCSEFQFEKHQCLCILALRGKRDFRSWVEDPKQCPPKQPLLLSPLWQLKFFSRTLPLLSGGIWESLGQNVPSSLVSQMIKEANQAWFSVTLLFQVAAAVSCVSKLWQGLHIFSPFDIWMFLPCSEIWYGWQPWKTLEEVTNSFFRAGIKLCLMQKNKGKNKILNNREVKPYFVQ